MPELPEVETVCRGLRPKLVGRKIVDVKYHRANLRFAFPTQLPKLAKDRTIKAVERQSKYILFTLDDGARILLHLGMSGRLSFYDAKDFKPGKHDHVVFTFNRGPLLAFNDARRFGVLDYIPPQQTHRLLETTGLDPFMAALTPQWLHDRTAKKSVSLKALLMDQKLIAGLGNIYVCEALFVAKLWPERLASSLTLAECKKLVPAIRKVLNASIDAGGSSLRDYVQVDGELGHFQKTFNVYGREGKPCPKCGHEVTRLVQSGRSTFCCRFCQK